MKKNVLLFTMTYCSWLMSFSQTITLWSENFNNGCASNCPASGYGSWTVLNNIDGVSGSSPNNWFVSCAEEGVLPPGCGSTCVGDASLHVGADPGSGGDMGASYNETGAANATFKLVVSPTISTVGHSSNTLKFDFIAFGSASCSDDRLQLRLSTDNGVTWPVGFQYCLTSPCCGACNGYSQGQWTAYTLALPAAFDNNANVRVGFHWRNNGNGSGTDPSAALDDIKIITTAPLPIQLVEFSAQKESNYIKLKWVSSTEINFSHYEIQRSTDGKDFQKTGKVDAKGNNSKDLTYYSFNDKPNEAQILYYRLKMVDKDGKFQYSNVVTATLNITEMTVRAIDHVEDFVTFYLNSPNSTVVDIQVFTTGGALLRSSQDKKITGGDNFIMQSMTNVASGIYLLKVINKGELNNSSQSLVKKFVWVN